MATVPKRTPTKRAATKRTGKPVRKGRKAPSRADTTALIGEALEIATEADTRKQRGEAPDQGFDEGYTRQTGAVVRRRRTNRDYEWEKAKARYVEGVTLSDGTVHFPTLRDVATYFGYPEPRVRDRSSKDMWKEQRAVFQRRVEVEHHRERIKQLAADKTEFDGSTLNLAKLGTQLILLRMGEISQDEQRHLRKREAMSEYLDGGGPRDELGYSPVYSREMNELANAAERFQAIGLRALGETQQIEVTADVTHKHIDVRDEMLRDSPDRMYRLVQAAAQLRIFEEPFGVIDIPPEDVKESVEDPAG